MLLDGAIAVRSWTPVAQACVFSGWGTKTGAFCGCRADSIMGYSSFQDLMKRRGIIIKKGKQSMFRYNPYGFGGSEFKKVIPNERKDTCNFDGYT